MENVHLSELVERVLAGEPWHGPNVREVLSGVSAANANRRVAPGMHTIWELVLHMTGWADEVRQRLDGRPAREPEQGDWPEVGEITEERWAGVQAALFDSHRQLAAAIRALDANALHEPVTDYRNSALGTGLSKYLTLHGLIHHTVYHSGQIAIIRRALFDAG